MPVRTRPRPWRIRYITNANPKPRTSSTATLTTVLIRVVLKSVHHTGSVRTVASLDRPTNSLPAGSVSRSLYSDRTTAYTGGYAVTSTMTTNAGAESISPRRRSCRVRSDIGGGAGAVGGATVACCSWTAI